MAPLNSRGPGFEAAASSAMVANVLYDTKAAALKHLRTVVWASRKSQCMRPLTEHAFTFGFSVLYDQPLLPLL
jgi:hypothetical protein